MDSRLSGSAPPSKPSSVPKTNVSTVIWINQRFWVVRTCINDRNSVEEEDECQSALQFLPIGGKVQKSLVIVVVDEETGQKKI